MDFDRDKVVASFLVECEEGLQMMEEALVAIENDHANSELLNDIFRVAHTMKGNASALDFPELAGFAHVVEDLLDSLRNRSIEVTGDLISLLLHTVDALRTLVPAAVEGNDKLSPSHVQLKQEIADFVKGNSVPSKSQSETEEEQTGKPGLPTVARTKFRTLRVAVEKLDCMLDLTGEIAITHGRLRRMVEDLHTPAGAEILEMLRDAERLHKDLQEQVMGVRMVPIGPLLQQLVRAVRDISQTHNKLSTLQIIGEDVEVDTRVFEHLKDPLLHMIRNAVDHGIETPERRHALGKNPCGSLTLRASHSSGNIHIQLSDDGAGFNRQKILSKAKSLGLVSDVEKMSDEDVFRLVFSAGFSTAETVTDLSGRGVGMDVVRRNIDALRGKIDIESQEGLGSTITIRLPLTLAIIEGFSVLAGDETYVIPLEMVSECLELPRDHNTSNGGGVISLRGEPLPYLRLRDVLGFEGASSGREKVVVLSHDGGRAGLAVDQLLGESQAIIKPLSRLFQEVRGISGSTILGDGRVALILDVSTLMKDAISNHSEFVN
jgi:two-component system, chemotaxis family, sensor kinase CheA